MRPYRSTSRGPGAQYAHLLIARGKLLEAQPLARKPEARRQIAVALENLEGTLALIEQRAVSPLKGSSSSALLNPRPGRDRRTWQPHGQPRSRLRGDLAELRRHRKPARR